MKKTVTIKDVAKQAGVSISTVSRVINDSKPVTDEIKQRVVDVIKETGYIPNPLARSLVTKKSQLIGVIVPEVSDTFVNEILNGIEEIAKMYDYDILLSNTYSDKEQELKSINLLKAKQVEGIVLISWVIGEDHVNFIQNSGIPATYISKTARDYDIYTVSTSNKKATFDMTEHLINKGHNKILTITSKDKNSDMYMDRTAGYLNAMKETNLEPHIMETNMDFESQVEFVNQNIEELKKYTAIFIQQDIPAISINQELKLTHNINVPDDISIITYNNIELIDYFKSELTTIDDKREAVVKNATDYLAEAVNKNYVEDIKRVQYPSIIERGSVKSIN